MIGMGIFTGFSKLFSVFFMFGARRGILILLLSVVLLSAVFSSIKEKSIEPVVNEVGGRMINADNVLYQNTYEILKLRSQAQEGLIESTVIKASKFMLVYDIIKTLLFLWAEIEIIFFVVSRLIIRNTSDPFLGLVITIILILFITSIMSIFNYVPVDGKELHDLNFREKINIINPVKGLIFTVSHFTELAGDIPTGYVDFEKPTLSVGDTENNAIVI